MEFKNAHRNVLRVCKPLMKTGAPMLEDMTLIVFPKRLACKHTAAHTRPNIVNDAHLRHLHRFARHIQFPTISLNELAFINLNEYTSLQSLKLTLLPPASTSHVEPQVIQLEWSKEVEKCLPARRPTSSVTVRLAEAILVGGVLLNLYVCRPAWQASPFLPREMVCCSN